MNPTALGGSPFAGFPGAYQGGQSPIGYAGENQLGHNGAHGATPVHNNGIYRGIHNRPYHGGASAAYTGGNQGIYNAGAPAASYTGENIGAYNRLPEPAYGQGNGYGEQSNAQYTPEISNSYNAGPSAAYTAGNSHYPGGNNVAHAGTDEVLIPRRNNAFQGSNGPVYAGGNVPNYEPAANYNSNNGGGSSYEVESVPSYAGSGENNQFGGNSYDYPSGGSSGSGNSYSSYGNNRRSAGA